MADVALSFAAAQRDYVDQVAAALKARGVRCFYDADEEIGLWGKYLAEELPAIYSEQAAAVVVFVSAEYAARDWTRLERRAALNRAVLERGEYVLPARFDDTALPGLLSDVSYVDLRTRTPQRFAAMIAEKLAILGIGPSSSPGEAGREPGVPDEVSYRTVSGTYAPRVRHQAGAVARPVAGGKCEGTLPLRLRSRFDLIVVYVNDAILGGASGPGGPIQEQGVRRFDQGETQASNLLDVRSRQESGASTPGARQSMYAAMNFAAKAIAAERCRTCGAEAGIQCAERESDLPHGVNMTPLARYHASALTKDRRKQGAAKAAEYPEALDELEIAVADP